MTCKEIQERSFPLFGYWTVGCYHLDEDDENLTDAPRRREIDQHNVRQQLCGIQANLQALLQWRIANGSLRPAVANPRDTRVTRRTLERKSR